MTEAVIAPMPITHGPMLPNAAPVGAKSEADWLREGARPALADAFAAIPGDSPYRGSYVRDLFREFIAGNVPYDPLLWKVFNLERMRAGDAFVGARQSG